MAYLPVRAQKNKNTSLRDVEAQIINSNDSLFLGETVCCKRFVKIFDRNSKSIVYGLSICIARFLPEHPPALVSRRNFKDSMFQKDRQPRPEKYVDLNLIMNVNLMNKDR